MTVVFARGGGSACSVCRSACAQCRHSRSLSRPRRLRTPTYTHTHIHTYAHTPSLSHTHTHTHARTHAQVPRCCKCGEASWASTCPAPPPSWAPPHSGTACEPMTRHSLCGATQRVSRRAFRVPAPVPRLHAPMWCMARSTLPCTARGGERPGLRPERVGGKQDGADPVH